MLLAHVGLANLLKAPKLVIDQGEADKLASAVDALLAHYINIDVDAKTRDWIALIMVAGGIYGPRVLAAAMEKKKKDPVKSKPMLPSELQPMAPTIVRVPVPGLGEAEVPLQ